jgi:disulfide bond formation protein DsbB
MNAPLIRCDVAPWTLLGISLAGFNFLISVASAALVFALLGRRKQGVV